MAHARSSNFETLIGNFEAEKLNFEMKLQNSKLKLQENFWIFFENFIVKGCLFPNLVLLVGPRNKSQNL